MSWTDQLGIRFDEENWIFDYTDTKLAQLVQTGNKLPCRVIFSFSSKVSDLSSEKVTRSIAIIFKGSSREYVHAQANTTNCICVGSDG